MDITEVFPIGAWTYMPVREYDETWVDGWKDLGLTLPMGPRFRDVPEDRQHMRRVLDWAWERGIRVVLCDPRTMAFRAPGYEEQAALAVADFGNHPATYGFLVTDEPKEADAEAVMRACRALRRLCPEREPVVNFFPWLPWTETQVGCRDWDAYLDGFAEGAGLGMLSYDCYEQMNPGDEGPRAYFRNLETYRGAAERNGVEFWNTVLSVGVFDYRVPTEDDLRWQLWTSLAHGAAAVFYFFLYMREPHENYRLSPYDEMGRRTPTYDALRRVNHGFLRRWGRLMPRLRLRSVGHWPHASCERTAQWGPTPLVASVAATREHVIASEFEDRHTGQVYLMVVNNSPFDTSRISVAVRGDVRVFHRNWLDDGESEVARRRAGADTLIEQWYAPGQGEIFRIEACDRPGCGGAGGAVRPTG